MKNSLLSYACLLASVFLLSGCLGLAVGAGATAGVAVAQEGGITGAVTDTSIQLQINNLWVKNNFDMFRKLDMTVKEGRVLITGSVPSPDMRVEAIRLAWQVEGVKQIINEITVDEGHGIGGLVTDSWVTSSLKTKFMFDKYIQSINYNVETVNGNVYLMGIAQDQRELDRAMEHARNTRYVKNVVNYMRLRGEKPVGVQEPVSNK
jgi:osmotically-inducible protein OsmY